MPSTTMDNQEETATPSAGTKPTMVANGTSATQSQSEENKDKKQKKENAQVKGKKAPAPAEEENPEKLSGAELKKRKQAEKAARRAQDKQIKQTPAPVEVKGPGKPGIGSEALKKLAVSTPMTPTAKGQHKRTGSISKPLPMRPVQSQAAPPASQPKEPQKVALFGHLYGQTRRTTIAGAGRDVHPAVLAFGLQMSNYVICGSSARCVAMLLVVKRVWPRYSERCTLLNASYS